MNFLYCKTARAVYFVIRHACFSVATNTEKDWKPPVVTWSVLQKAL